MPNDRTRLPLPEPHGQFLVWDYNAKPNDPVRYRDIFTADQMHAYYDAAYRAGLEAAANAIYNTPLAHPGHAAKTAEQLEMVIRALEVSHD